MAKRKNNLAIYNLCRAITYVSLIFISPVSNGAIIKLKFQLYNSVDSSIIKLEEVNMAPIKSYLVEEKEHHEKPSKKYDFQDVKIYFDKISKCNIFEYEANQYPFNDIYLTISSDSFYYSRQWESDYDEANCIHFKTDSIGKIYKVYLSPYKFLNLMNGMSFNNDWCLETSIWIIYGNDTAKCHPVCKKTNKINSGNIIQIFALNNLYKYLLLVEIYGEKNYSYSYYNLNNSKNYIVNVNLNELQFIDYPYFGKSKNCIKYSNLTKEKKFTEYY